MADTDIVQVIAEARVDARSLSEFVFKPADFMVQRRLAPPINTLNFYLDKFDAVAADANSAISMANNSISIANNSIGAANALIADANAKILAADGVVADAYAGAEQRFFDTANNNLNSQIDVYLSAQDIGKSVFDTPQAGVDAGIANGSYYSVRSTDSDYFLEEYKNNAGTPQATGKKYPAAKFLLTKGVFTVSELLILGDTATAGARFNTHGFYAKGDCLPSVFEVQTVAVGDVFTDIGNGTLIGDDASIKINSTKKLKLIANESVALSQLGGIKTAQSTTTKNDVVGSVILKNFRNLLVDGFYTLQGRLWVGVNNTIFGTGKKSSGIRQGDNVNQYLLQSINSDIKNEVFLNDYLEIANLTLDGNFTKNNVRDYSQDINFTYWGFGIAVFNTNDFYIHDVHTKDTEAWGISYHVCNRVRGYNLTFDQAVDAPSNKDGITGSGKRVHYKNLSGYTSDDMCAVGCGRSTLGGVDTGITVNMVVEYVEVDGLEGGEKGGRGTLFGVGVYGPDVGLIKNVVIKNITGVFTQAPIRLANYWFVSKKVKFNSIIIENIFDCVLQKQTNGVFTYLYINYIDCDSFIFNKIHHVKNGDYLTPFSFINSVLTTLKNSDATNIYFEQNDSTQNAFVMVNNQLDVIGSANFDKINAVSDVAITDNIDATNGLFAPMSNIAKMAVSSFRLGEFNSSFKQAAMLAGIATAHSKNNIKKLSIDYLDIPSGGVGYYASVMTGGSGASIISCNMVIRQSVIYIEAVLDLSIVSPSAEFSFLSFGAALNFKKMRVINYTPSDGLAVPITTITSSAVVRLVAPIKANPSITPGTYRVNYIDAIPII